MIDEARGLLESPGGVAGTIGAAVTAGAIFLRKYWLTDKVDKAISEGTAGLIASMSEQIDKANARADAAEQRANDATDKMQVLMDELGVLRGEVARLTLQVERQNRLLSDQSVQIRSLQGPTP